MKTNNVNGLKRLPTFKFDSLTVDNKPKKQSLEKCSVCEKKFNSDDNVKKFDDCEKHVAHAVCIANYICVNKKEEIKCPCNEEADVEEDDSGEFNLSEDEEGRKSHINGTKQESIKRLGVQLEK